MTGSNIFSNTLFIIISCLNISFNLLNEYLLTFMSILHKYYVAHKGHYVQLALWDKFRFDGGDEYNIYFPVHNS